MPESVSHLAIVVLAPLTFTLPPFSSTFVKSPSLSLRVPVLSVMTSCISSIFAAPISKLPLIVIVSSELKSVTVTSLTCAEISIVSAPSPEVTVAPEPLTVIESSPAPALIESAPPAFIVSSESVACTTQLREPVLIFCAAEVEAV